MQDDIKENVNKLLERSVKAEKSDDAMKFAQAALNVAHVLATIAGAEHLDK